MTAPNDVPRRDAPLRLTFPACFRLRSKRDFERIYALKQKAVEPVLLVFGSRNSLSHSRMGLSVSRRHGNSVVRHRLRRLLKEAFRLKQHELPVGFDLILIPGRDAGGATQAQFCDALLRVARKLERKIPRLSSGALAGTE